MGRATDSPFAVFQLEVQGKVIFSSSGGANSRSVLQRLHQDEGAIRIDNEIVKLRRGSSLVVQQVNGEHEKTHTCMTGSERRLHRYTNHMNLFTSLCYYGKSPVC